MTFPKDFIWGTAAASYQIEGSAGGREECGESVWDMVCRRPGFIQGDNTGHTACDHYHRYEEDTALMAEIGVHAYRLSVMWPRVMPQGTGTVNKKGLDFYDRLVDSLLSHNIEPWITLFHWDFPLALFHRGGWLNEDAPQWFADYTKVIVDRLSDRVSRWFTLNEPACFIGLGHQDGVHAPGLQLAPREVNRAWHHALLAHGRAVQVIRSRSRRAALIGAAPNFSCVRPATETDADITAAQHEFFRVSGRDMFQVSWWMEPIINGAYPEDGLELWGADRPAVKPGDMDIIGQPLDFFGFNCYHAVTVRADDSGKPVSLSYGHDYPHTDMSWPVTPDCLYWSMRFLAERYRLPLIVTENGMAGLDWVDHNGHVPDGARIDYLVRHLQGVRRALREGIDVRGYFHWSIMDNFEWAAGYAKRFGLIHVDYRTQKRTIKDSGHWYGELIRQNGASLPEGDGMSGWPQT